MKPHPLFSGFQIPSEHRLGPIVLKALGIADLDRDFEAVMESKADIQAAFPGGSWPQGLTREKNLVDLGWHQKEFETGRSFAWIIEDLAGNYLGCVYVYPSIAGDKSADVVWWWRTGARADKPAFASEFLGWLNGPDWPDLTYTALGRRETGS
ncbi:MAG: hypothetical protein AAF441_08355 [Pseudomonadota bacterium]